MSFNLPPGCTNADIERACGGIKSRYADPHENETGYELADRALNATKFQKANDERIMNWRWKYAQELRAKRKG